MGQIKNYFRLPSTINLIFFPNTKLNMTSSEMRDCFRSTAINGTDFCISKGKKEKEYILYTSQYKFSAYFWYASSGSPVVTGFKLTNMWRMTQSDTIKASLGSLLVATDSHVLYLLNERWDDSKNPDGMAALLAALEGKPVTNKNTDSQEQKKAFYQAQNSIIEHEQTFATNNGLTLSYNDVQTVTQGNPDGTDYNFSVGRIMDDNLRKRIKEGMALSFKKNDERMHRATVVGYDYDSGMLRVTVHKLDFHAIPSKGTLTEEPNPCYRYQQQALNSIENGTAHNPYLESMIMGEKPLPIDINRVPYEPPEGVRLNDMQLKAIRMAINTEDFLLIQGPPGTGKTSIIVEMVRHFVHQGQRVLICSQSNHAVDNVLKKCLNLWHDEEKTHKIQCLRIGSGDKIEDALRNNLRRPLTQTIQNDMKSRSATALPEYIQRQTQRKEQLAAAQVHVGTITRLMETLYQLRSDASSIRRSLPIMLISLIFAPRLTFGIMDSLPNIWSSIDEMIIILEELLNHSEVKADVSIQQLEKHVNEIRRNWTIIQNLFARYPIRSKLVIVHKNVNRLQETMPQSDGIIQNLLSQLNRYTGNPLAQTIPYSKATRNNFADHLSAYRKKVDVHVRQIDANLKGLQSALTDWHQVLNCDNESIGDALLKSVKIVGATCIGTSTKREFNEMRYDVVIVDEAGQIAMHDLLVPLSKAKKIILIGDHMQLPPMENNEFAADYEQNRYPLEYSRLFGDEQDAAFYYPFRSAQEVFSKSLFEVLFNNPVNSNHIVMLDTQYRMHPTIAEFISQKFYHGKYGSGRSEDDLQMTINPFDKPIYFYDTRYLKNNYQDQEDKSYFNLCEAQLCAKHITDLIIAGLSAKDLPFPIYDKFGNFDIGVITAYSPQIDRIRSCLMKQLRTHFDSDEAIALAQRVKINTLDSFQGMENRIIIYSFVRSRQLAKKKLYCTMSVKKPQQNVQPIKQATRRPSIGFMNDVRRLNVLMTRAQSLLIMVGNSRTLTKTAAKTKHDGTRAASYYSQLIHYCKEKNGYIPLREED